jgi:hypothetical protein
MNKSSFQKRLVRSSVNKTSVGNFYISPITISDEIDSSVNNIHELVSNLNNNLGINSNCLASSAIALLTSSTSIIKALGGISEHFISEDFKTQILLLMEIVRSTPSSIPYTSATKFIRHLTYYSKIVYQLESTYSYLY